MTDRDAMIEAVARGMCKSGKFETGHGTCAVICMDQLGDARKGPCRHAETVHRDLATTALLALEPFITAREQAAREEGRKQAHQDRPSDGYRVGSAYGRADEQSAIVAWLRSDTLDVRQFYNPGRLADAIERNEHREQKDG